MKSRTRTWKVLTPRTRTRTWQIFRSRTRTRTRTDIAISLLEWKLLYKLMFAVLHTDLETNRQFQNRLQSLHHFLSSVLVYFEPFLLGLESDFHIHRLHQSIFSTSSLERTLEYNPFNFTISFVIWIISSWIRTDGSNFLVFFSWQFWV